jgi:uncharacterized protein YjbI with pentapeptide repeats
MRWRKRDLWKAAIVVGSVVFLALMTLVTVSAADAQGGVSAARTVTVQATPTEDATVAALQKQQLVLQNKQLQQSEDRSFDAWLWNNAAAIVASFLSTLVVVIGALIGFRQWRTNRNDTLTKEANDRKEAQEKDLRAQAEERFKAAVTALGSENEATQVGGAILLQSFLNTADKKTYRRYYAQIFDIAVAYLRLPNTSLLTEDRERKPLSPKDLPAPVQLTPLRQALIAVFREAFTLAREQGSRRLDATGIQLDHAYLVDADLKQAWVPYASLRKAEFAYASLQGAYLRGSHFEGAEFVGANLKGANFTIAHLEGVNFNDAHLEEANLGGSHLKGAYFEDAHLKGAQLGNADLSGVHLNRTDLTDADLSNSNLEEANIEEAKSLKGTNLRGVKGLNAKQLLGCKLKSAIVDEETMVSAIEKDLIPPPSPQ